MLIVVCPHEICLGKTYVCSFERGFLFWLMFLCPNFQGLEDLSLSDDNFNDKSEEDTQYSDNREVFGCTFDDDHAVNGLDDLYKINLKDMKAGDVMRYHFPDLGVAFMFYN